MDVQHERRAGDDRREFALYYRYGSERRDNTENRRSRPLGDGLHDSAASLAPGSRRAFDRSREIIEEVAQAFGVAPDALEMVKHDDLLNDSDHCQTCADQARRCAELEVELAASRAEAERYRSQVRELLLSVSSRRQ